MALGPQPLVNVVLTRRQWAKVYRSIKAEGLPRPRHPICLGVQISCLCHPEIQNSVTLYRFLGLI